VEEHLNQDRDLSRNDTNDNRANAETLEGEAMGSAQAGEEDPIMTPAEAARYLRISVATLQRLSRSGEIPGFHVGKLWRYRKSALDEWMCSKVSFFRHPCRK
jgi:excisionase family DNA binding protein